MDFTTWEGLLDKFILKIPCLENNIFSCELAKIFVKKKICILIKAFWGLDISHANQPILLSHCHAIYILLSRSLVCFFLWGVPSGGGGSVLHYGQISSCYIYRNITNSEWYCHPGLCFLSSFKYTLVSQLFEKSPLSNDRKHFCLWTSKAPF